jgi:hypothetical protein
MTDKLEKEYNELLDYSKSFEDNITFDPICIREKSNSSLKGDFNLIDNLKKENLAIFKNDKLKKEQYNKIKYGSPKLVDLMNNIKKLDEKDHAETGKYYKHFIFTDLKSRRYGVNLIASMLMLNNWELGYYATFDQKQKPSKLIFKNNETLEKNKYNNFYVLTSRSVFKQPINSDSKKTILSRFNSRPDNIYGENIRIIIMDSGFKEGIDLFDIKYVHVFEPQETISDLKQVIGRGTRTCGQKGLPFDNEKGWPLHVYIYDMDIPVDVSPLFDNSKTAYELYLKAQNKDYKLLNFINTIEQTISANAVDNVLTLPVHNMGKKYDNPEKSGLLGYNPPREKMSASALKRYIENNYSDFTWESPKIENGCIDVTNTDTSATKEGSETNKVKLLNYTMSQGFVSNYFTPLNYAKGMLLWHSVGTGKTCTAIATASKAFEDSGYTILWVTRTTLKSDIWKNIFDQSCHDKIRRHLTTSNKKMPLELKRQKKLLSKSWAIQPISYKQFTNLIEKKNNIYKSLVKINGAADPLRKTLIIIDEAHKLYGATDLSTIERPNTEKLHEALMTSYELSGENSVRLLLMTATPITSNPMEIVQLLNLLKPIREQMPSNFNSFATKYLNSEAEFTESGKEEFCNEIAGYVSYLNLEKDLRKFAQPVLHKAHSKLIDSSTIFDYDKRNTGALFKQMENIVDKKIDLLKGELLLTPSSIKTTYIKSELNEKICDALENKELKKPCNKIITSNLKELKKEVKEGLKDVKNKIKTLKNEKKKLKESRKSKTQNITKNLKKVPKDYFNNPFFAYNSKCRIKQRNPTINELINNLPNVSSLNNEINGHNESIKQIIKENKEINKINSKLKKLVKTGNSGDVAMVTQTIKDNKDAIETNKDTIKEHKGEIIELNKTRRKTSKLEFKRIHKEHKENIRTFKNKYALEINKLHGDKLESLVKNKTIKIKEELQEKIDNFKCPEGKVYDKEKGKCVKEKIVKEKPKKVCPEGKILNEKTGRCVKDKTKKKDVSITPAPKTPPSTNDDKVNKSEKTKRVCPEGKILNEKTGRCIKDRTKKKVGGKRKW